MAVGVSCQSCLRDKSGVRGSKKSRNDWSMTGPPGGDRNTDGDLVFRWNGDSTKELYKTK